MFLCLLARPDLFLLAVVLAGYHLIRSRRLPTIGMVTLFLVPILAWLVFSVWYFGELVPSTLHAKLAQTTAGLWGKGLVFFKGFTSGFIWLGGDFPRDPLARVLLVVLIGMFVTAGIAGLTTAVARCREWSLFRHPAFHLILLWNFTYLIAYGFVLNAPAYSWYYTPLALTFALVMTLPAQALRDIISRWNARASRYFPIATLGVLVGIGCLGHTLPTRNWERGKYEMYREAAAWLNADAEDGAAVGAGDIGVLRFFYEKGPIICEVGLVTPDVVDHMLRGEYDWYIRHYQPGYLMLMHPPDAEVEAWAGQAWFEDRYRRERILRSKMLSVALYKRTGSPR